MVTWPPSYPNVAHNPMVVPTDTVVVTQGDGTSFRAQLSDLPAPASTPFVVTPEQFGAIGNGSVDDSGAFQSALNALAILGGGLVKCTPSRNYLFRFPVCLVGSNLTVDCTGCEISSDLSTAGRPYGPIWQIGNSREWNLTTIVANRAQGNFSSGFSNASFTDTPLGTYPGPTSSSIVSSNCYIFGGRFVFSDAVNQTGNYAVQFSNCAKSGAWGYTSRNASQAFGFGSDVAPNNPYAVQCFVHDIIVEQANPFHTYYAIGFHGYASQCYDWDCQCIYGSPDGTPDGNLWSSSYAQNCVSKNSGGDCGRGTNGQGFLFGTNSTNCTVIGGYVSRAKQAFANGGPLSITAATGNVFQACVAWNVDYLIAMSSHYCLFSDVHGYNIATAELLFANVNASNNRIVNCDNARMVPPSGQAVVWGAIFNQIEGRTGIRQVVIRPWEYLRFLDATSTNIQSQGPHSLAFNTFTGSVTMRVPLSTLGNFTAFTDVKLFGNLAAGSHTAGASAVFNIIQTGPTPVTGNTSSSDVVIQGPFTFTPPTDSTYDYTFEYAAPLDVGSLGDPAYTSDIWLQIVITNPTAGSTIKDGTLSGYSA